MDVPVQRTPDSISEEEALSRFNLVLAQPIQALGLNVVVGWDLSLLAFVGEDAMFTDLAFSMAGPHRHQAFEDAGRLTERWADPLQRPPLAEQRRQARIACGRLLVCLDADAIPARLTNRP